MLNINGYADQWANIWKFLWQVVYVYNSALDVSPAAKVMTTFMLSYFTLKYTSCFIYCVISSTLFSLHPVTTRPQPQRRDMSSLCADRSFQLHTGQLSCDQEMQRHFGKYSEHAKQLTMFNIFLSGKVLHGSASFYCSFWSSVHIGLPVPYGNKYE